MFLIWLLKYINKKEQLIMEHEIKLYGDGKNHMPITKLYGYGKQQYSDHKIVWLW